VARKIMQEKQILVKGLSANYKVIGEGQPFLILHGWGSSSEKWQRVGEILAQEKLKIIMVDLPGFGKSQEPEKPWSLDNYVEWLLAFCELVPELKNQFYISGHSFGGALAAKFSIKYVQRVKGLFLISSACVRNKTAIKKIFYRVAKIGKVLSFLPLYSQARKGFYKYIIRKSDYPYQSGVMKETYLKIILDDLSHKVGFLKVRTFIIWGDKDESTPVTEARWLFKKIPRAKLTVIPGADHLLHVKIPEVLAAKILEYI